MARQTGEYKITGTYEDGTYYTHRKSSLKGERVKNDPKFRRTMQSAYRLGWTSQLASKVHRSLPRQEQVYVLNKELKGMAIRAMREEKTKAEVLLQVVQAILSQMVQCHRNKPIRSLLIKKRKGQQKE